MWPSPDPILEQYVLDRQRAALDAYRANPDLIEEHLGQEDSFRLGGYGTRQVSELLQNAVDALTLGRAAGRIEFRLVDGVLYCANQGAGFSEAGIRAVCMAFLSPKREEDTIGRFGLGFKSVLGISDRPQIFSRGVAFQFNGPESAALFEGLVDDGAPLPLLRVPSVVDARAEIAADADLAELTEWATTVVKLPLSRDGARIRKEIGEFDTRLLLFMKQVDALTVALQDVNGKLVATEHRRSFNATGDRVTLTGAKGIDTEWRFAERTYVPSVEVAAGLPATARQKKMTVTYAVPTSGGASELGSFWAWFPLEDQTTARGIFNAPWQVNDDRTKMLASSEMNGELLEVCAELFLDIASTVSTPADPGAHLDLFPARGKEVRGNADGYLSVNIPLKARERALIPDADGEFRTRDFFAGIPDLSKGPMPAPLVEIWLKASKRRNLPHPSLFTKARDRYTRLRTLLRDGASASSYETTVQRWVEELARQRTMTSVRAALEIVNALRRGSTDVEVPLDFRVVPLEGGGWAGTQHPDRAMLPKVGEPVPEGAELVATEFASDPEIDRLFRALGFKPLSSDQIVVALAEKVTPDWSDDEWSAFWGRANSVAPAVAIRALERVRARSIAVKVATADGVWRDAGEVFASSEFSTLEHRTASADVHRGGLDLLRAAGAIDGATSEYPVHSEPVFAEYASAFKKHALDDLRSRREKARELAVPRHTGAGPLQAFIELAGDDDALCRWTEKILGHMAERTWSAGVVLADGTSDKIVWHSPEWWAIAAYGRVMTTQGPKKPGEVVGTGLGRYSAVLPMVTGRFGLHVDLPKTLEQVPASVLKESLAAIDRLPAQSIHAVADVCAALVQKRVRRPASLPAVLNGVIGQHAAEDVVLAVPEDVAVVEEHGLPYIPVGDDPEVWSPWELRTSGDALSRSIEIVAQQEDSPLLDVFPSLASLSMKPLGRYRLAKCGAVIHKTITASGIKQRRTRSHRFDDDLLLVDDSLDRLETLLEVARLIGLAGSRAELAEVLKRDDRLAQSALIDSVRSATDDAQRLLLLLGAKRLSDKLPRGVLDAVESRAGKQSDVEIARLFLQVNGIDSLKALRADLETVIPNVPEKWAGSEHVQGFVKNLGFPTAFAGQRVTQPAQVEQVQGRIDIGPLHDFQEDLARQIRDHVLEPSESGDPQRGLLFLPTGAGKTRVTVQSLIRLMLAGELQGPILWIAQSAELCEQAVQTWTDVWRALGDSRVLDISRFWDAYELDESENDFQVVVATDAKIASRIKPAYAGLYTWLADASVVIVDEAHTAGSMTYTEILRWLGLTFNRTARPLLGLTATPFRGRNEEINRRFADRFGNKRLNALDPDDPMGQLRDLEVLAEVDHQLLEGGRYVPKDNELAEFQQMKDVSKAMLGRIGDDLDRTQALVDHVLSQDPEWPILVFTASVASAHTVAALLTREGREARAVDGATGRAQRRRAIDQFKAGEVKVLVNCDLLTQGFDAPMVRALYVARPTFSPNRYIQMIGRGLRGPRNGGTEVCTIVNVSDTFDEFGDDLAFNEFDHLWSGK